MTLPTVFNTCTPRSDVLDSTIAEADFAADLAKVIRNEGSLDYRDPSRFFAQTYPTKGLRNLLQNVLARLSGDPSAMAAIFRLDTSYGGGKTHALISGSVCGGTAPGNTGTVMALMFAPVDGPATGSGGCWFSCPFFRAIPR